MISVTQFENMEIKIPDDFFEPVLAFSDLDIIQMIAGNKPKGRVIKFVGRETGIELSSDFFEILESHR